MIFFFNFKAKITQFAPDAPHSSLFTWLVDTKSCFINQNDYFAYSSRFGNYYMHFSFTRATFNGFLLLNT